MNLDGIHVYYTENTSHLTRACFDFYFNQLPLPEQERIMNYKRAEDRQATLLGKALLIIALKQANRVANWENLKRNPYGKPYFDPGNDIAFNISHSGNYVVTAISNVPVGVDIEEIRQVNIDDFENCFSEKEWLTLKESPDPLQQFFEYWSIKEAVIKTAGSGLSIALRNVLIGEASATIGFADYPFKKLAFPNNYSLVVASTQALPPQIRAEHYGHYFEWQQVTL